MMIVVALMALLSGVVVGGTGMLSGARLRSASSLVVGAVRLAITHANSTGEAVRLVFDFEERRVILEEASGRMLRTRADAEGGPQAGAEPATDLEREAVDYAQKLLDGPKAPPARFRPIDALSGEDGKPGRALGRGIRFFQVQTEHDEEPRAEGRAYLYVWPGGATEQAAVQLGKTDEMSGVTVLVNALTGRARIQRGRIELEQAREEGALSEWEDDG